MKDSLIKRDREVVWHPFTQVQTEAPPIPIIKAKDSLMYDVHGKTYIDCNSSWWVNVHGHGHPKIAAALSEQFQAVDHVLLAGITHPKAVELAEKIIDILPEGFSKVFYSDNGSTAVEVAIKMAMQFWYNKNTPKNRFLAIEGAYHGDTFGAMSLGERGHFNKPFEAFFFEADFLEFPTVEKEEKILAKAEQLFQSGEFAAVIVEPLVQGSAGMRMYSAKWLSRLMDLAQKHDVLIIFDEVMTGWGRTGKLFAMEYCDRTPDIVCLSKGLTAGVLPMGLTVAKEYIFQAFLDDDKLKALLHGHSFTGNALACAVACANVDIFKEENTWKNIDRITQQHEIFAEHIKKHKQATNIRQYGTIVALEVKTPEETSYFSSLRDSAFAYFVEHGIFLRPLGNVLFLNPPYCTTNEQLEYCYKHIEAFLDQVESKS